MLQLEVIEEQENNESDVPEGPAGAVSYCERKIQFQSPEAASLQDYLASYVQLAIQLQKQ